MIGWIILGLYLYGAARAWKTMVRENELTTDNPLDVMFAATILAVAAFFFWVPMILARLAMKAVTR